MGQERRQFARVLHPFDVQYRRYGKLGETWQVVTTLNLSAGGTRFRSEDALDTDEILELQIELPGIRERLMLRGRVTWCHMQASGVTEHGVEFIDVTGEQRAQIDNLVHFLRKRV